MASISALSSASSVCSVNCRSIAIVRASARVSLSITLGVQRARERPAQPELTQRPLVDLDEHDVVRRWLLGRARRSADRRSRARARGRRQGPARRRPAPAASTTTAASAAYPRRDPPPGPATRRLSHVRFGAASAAGVQPPRRMTRVWPAETRTARPPPARRTRIEPLTTRNSVRSQESSVSHRVPESIALPYRPVVSKRPLASSPQPRLRGGFLRSRGTRAAGAAAGQPQARRALRSSRQCQHEDAAVELPERLGCCRLSAFRRVGVSAD